MVKLENISLRNYGPQHLRAGDVFEATFKHATLLVAIGKCRMVREAIEKPEVEEKEEQVDISPRTGKPKRTYKRKDMVAE
jgi:hypothetical protein